MAYHGLRHTAARLDQRDAGSVFAAGEALPARQQHRVDDADSCCAPAVQRATRWAPLPTTCRRKRFEARGGDASTGSRCGCVERIGSALASRKGGSGMRSAPANPRHCVRRHSRGRLFGMIGAAVGPPKGPGTTLMVGRDCNNAVYWRRGTNSVPSVTEFQISNSAAAQHSLSLKRAIVGGIAGKGTERRCEPLLSSGELHSQLTQRRARGGAL